MKITKLLLLLTVGLFLSFSALCQEEAKAQTTNQEVQKTEAPKKQVQKPKIQGSLDSGTIESQFEYMIKKSNRYEVYRVVKSDWLYKMKGNVADSLNLAAKNLSEAESTISKQANEIDNLKAEMQKVNDQYELVTKEKNSISFIGILMNKSAYNGIMWTIIAGLLLLAIICFMLFKRSNAVTVATKQTLQDTQEEFDKHRKWALEREQKLARDLHKMKNQMG